MKPPILLSYSARAFEVENTTQITEAIVRGTNIPYLVKRFIIIPDEREKMLKNKFEEPLLKGRIIDDSWKIIPYGDLEKYYSGKKFDISSFEKISRLPKEKGKTTTPPLTKYA